MAGPQNGLIGDEDFGMSMPQSDISPDALKEVEHAVKFSKSREYKQLKGHMENRIAYYQSYLPDGRPVATVPTKELESMWVAANVIIGELKQIIAVYEQANDALKEATGVRRKGA